VILIEQVLSEDLPDVGSPFGNEWAYVSICWEEIEILPLGTVAEAVLL
jgi:hypothetical protein